jgi:hypothetical protein
MAGKMARELYCEASGEGTALVRELLQQGHTGLR